MMALACRYWYVCGSIEKIPGKYDNKADDKINKSIIEIEVFLAEPFHFDRARLVEFMLYNFLLGLGSVFRAFLYCYPAVILVERHLPLTRVQEETFISDRGGGGFTTSFSLFLKGLSLPSIQKNQATRCVNSLEINNNTKSASLLKTIIEYIEIRRVS